MYEFLRYRVGDVMTAEALTIREETALSEVERLFTKHGFNGLPVVDAAGTMVGLLTKLDFLKAFAFSTDAMVPHYDEIVARPARSVMTREPETVDSELPLTRVLERMVATRMRSFPVLDGKRLVGMVSREDVMTAVRRAAEGKGPARND
jgi:CBS domain-containing protein